MPFPPHNPPPNGVSALIGYVADLSDPDGTTRITLDIGPQHLNTTHILHGGLHATLLDAAAGFAAARYLAGEGAFQPVLTLSLTTDFIAGVASGTVTATGRVVGGGYKIVYADAQLCDADGKLLSRATGVFKRTSA